MTNYKLSWLNDSWKRWLAWLIAASVFAVACVFLSDWQFDRRQEALAKIEVVAQNYDQAPLTLQDVVRSDEFDARNEWRPVSITGQFLPEKAYLVRNRPYNGQPGFLQVIPFKAVTGQLVAIETGWLPTGSRQDSPDLIPLPDDQERTVLARIRPTEPTLNRDAPAGQLGTLNSANLFKQAGLSGELIESVYFRLAESYNQGEAVPKLLPKPALTEGNHLSYALQWILFALMAFSALIWGVRQELRFKRMAEDETYRPKKRKRVGDDDKAAEDALLGQE